MAITLTPAVEKALQRHARKIGTTPELLALQVLQERLLEPEAEAAASASENSGTLYDFLGKYFGILASREAVPCGAQLSVNSGRCLCSTATLESIGSRRVRR